MYLGVPSFYSIFIVFHIFFFCRVRQSFRSFSRSKEKEHISKDLILYRLRFASSLSNGKFSPLSSPVANYTQVPANNTLSLQFRRPFCLKSLRFTHGLPISGALCRSTQPCLKSQITNYSHIKLKPSQKQTSYIFKFYLLMSNKKLSTLHI